MNTPIPPDKYLFGQYLVENNIITNYILQKALKVQEKEGSSVLRESHRLLGQILLEEFKIFKSRIELNHYLESFKKFKEKIELMRFNARNYGKKK